MLLKSKSPLLSIVVLIFLALSVSQVNAKSQNAKTHEEYSKSIYPELIKLRRDLFEHPEASGQEKRTSAIVADYLTDLGLEVKTNIGGYGVVGILNGAKPGKRIAWRADMDAGQFVFGEHENHDVAHVCGHDVHTTIGLGIANTLSQDIENLEGTVYFLFQPAEESQKGAKAMINDGLFEVIQADEIYAAHVGPMPTGVIATKDGNLFSHSRLIEIEFNGTDGIDALSEKVNTIMTSVFRVKSPAQFTNLLTTSDPVLGLGNPETIYQNYVLFGGRPRARQNESKVIVSAELFTAELRDIAAVVDQLEKQISESDIKDRFATIRVRHEREGVSNNAELVRQANQILEDAFGDNVVENQYGQVPFASEDFGHFQKTVPGVYFFIGSANSEKGNVAFPHMPGFEVDEMVIHHGVSRFSTLIEHRMQL